MENRSFCRFADHQHFVEHSCLEFCAWADNSCLSLPLHVNTIITSRGGRLCALMWRRSTPRYCNIWKRLEDFQYLWSLFNDIWSGGMRYALFYWLCSALGPPERILDQFHGGWAQWCALLWVVRGHFACCLRHLVLRLECSLGALPMKGVVKRLLLFSWQCRKNFLFTLQKTFDDWAHFRLEYV